MMARTLVLNSYKYGVALALVIAGCDDSNKVGRVQNTGGADAGGNLSSGGLNSVGGIGAVGGTRGVGGTRAVGGVSGVGGNAPIGGTKASGGSTLSLGGVTSTNGGAGTGGAPASPCTETLDAVRNLWSDCPDAFCDAQIWATTCSNFPGVTVTSQVLSYHGYMPVIHVDWGTRQKNCYYDYSNNDTSTPLRLIAVELSADTPTFCGGTSTAISAGQVPVDSFVPQPIQLNTCSGGVSVSTGDAGQIGDAIPPAHCFDRLYVECLPCCTDPNPDCTGKPNGYPGHECSQADGSYCSCQCAGGQWWCGC